MGNTLNRLEVNIRFSLKSPYHVSADRISFGVDKAISLDPRDNRLIIPATSLKGIIRHNLESVINNKKSCTTPRPENMCNECNICRYFGSPKNKALLIFEDARVEEPELSSRIGIAIERKRKTTKEDHLFSYEIGYGKTFSTKIRGFFPKDDSAISACAYLYIGARLGFALGGGKSRGMGWMNLEDFRASVDRKEIPIDEINNKTLEILK